MDINIFIVGILKWIRLEGVFQNIYLIGLTYTPKNRIMEMTLLITLSIAFGRAYKFKTIDFIVKRLSLVFHGMI